jgi:hypothetical protein
VNGDQVGMRVYLSKEFNVRCPHCGRVVSYSQRYDAYLCMPCNLWLEQQCSEPSCGFCAGRAKEPDGLTDLDEAKPEEAEHAPPAMAKTAGLPAVSRNQPCPCGSGVKFKKCCGTPRTAPAPKVRTPQSDAHFLSRLSRLM